MAERPTWRALLDVRRHIWDAYAMFRHPWVDTCTGMRSVFIPLPDFCRSRSLALVEVGQGVHSAGHPM